MCSNSSMYLTGHTKCLVSFGDIRTFRQTKCQFWIAKLSRRKSDTSNFARKVIMITWCLIYPQVVYLLTLDFVPVVHRPHPHQYKFMTQRNTSLMMKISIFLELLFTFIACGFYFSGLSVWVHVIKILSQIKQKWIYLKEKKRLSTK